jgi:HAE1 family hydrophobic/amphiphilic exporter-1
MVISEICIKRPVFATVLSLVLIVIGLIFFTKLQIRSIPDINPPVISIAAYYPGANAEYMEQEVATKIEKALKTLKNLDRITSVSSVGSTNITLYFKLSANIEIALNDVRSKISEISDSLPDRMKPPSISKADSDNHPSFWISVSSDIYDSLELTRIVDERVKTPLEKLSGVGSAVIYGAKYYSMRIEPDPVKMYQHKITPTEIQDAIRKQNKDYPLGNIKTRVRDFTLRLNTSLTQPEEFQEIILKMQGNVALKLKDVASVTLAEEENDTILRYNGKRTILVGLIKQSNSNIIDLSKDALAELQKIKNNLPPGIKLDIAYDGATPVNASINSVFRAIIEALILVVLVTYLFLSSARITLIPFVTVPISLIATFSAMYFMGFSINTFTLLAMILSIGLVVDDAIVMLENIYRYHELGHSPIESAILASREIGFAIVAMTISLAAVFLPIGLIEGFIGKLFIEFAWTLAFCVLFSGFVALTLTPMMASLMIVHQDKPLKGFLAKFDLYLQYVQAKYLRLLNYAINNKSRFLIITSCSVVILVISFIYIDKKFVPEEDDGFLQVIFSGSEGASVDQSEKTLVEAEKVFASHPDILGFFEVMWSGDNAFAFVPLKDWSVRSKTQQQIKNDLNSKLQAIPGMSIFAISPQSLGGGGGGKKIEFNLQSSASYEELDKTSQEFINLMRKNPVFQNVDRDFKASSPTLDIKVDRDKAYIYGINLESIASTIQYLIGGMQIGDFRMGNDIYSIILQYNKNDKSNVDDLKKIFIKNNQDIILPLESVATLEETIAIQSYNHYNNSKSIMISADLGDKQKITDAIKEIDNIAAKILNINTTKLEYLGSIKQMKESVSNLNVSFIFALIFIYLVLCAQFESFSDPLIILFSVPFSMTGGVLALFIFGNSINLYSNIGLVTLIGLVTKNAIMIVEFANQLKSQGMRPKEAVIKASDLRLRPILMTTLATIFGSMPLIFATGSGAGARNSIGIVIAFGMLVGTIFTIFVIPVLYQSFKKE